MIPKPIPCEYVRLSAVAARLGVAPDTLRRWARQGKLPPVHKMSTGISGWPASIIEPAVQRVLTTYA